jgi:hypothetical protein
MCYTIWFSQRTGSTLLCSALASTGISGRPGEHLEGTLPELYARYGVTTPAELLSRVWAIGGTPNGVVGLKYGLVRHRFEDARLRPAGAGAGGRFVPEKRSTGPWRCVSSRAISRSSPTAKPPQPEGLDGRHSP